MVHAEPLDLQNTCPLAIPDFVLKGGDQYAMSPVEAHALDTGRGVGMRAG